MIQLIKNLFGFGGPQVDLRELAQQGAVILDVRTKSEYAGGHIKNSVNVPVDQLSNNLSKFKDKDSPIITCCASGMRSSTAKGILKSNGFTNVHNGGGWQSLQGKIS